MANSKFDLSLLKPVANESKPSFESQLKPVDDQEEDAGAYLDKLPQEEGFLHKLPRNILIGLSKLGHSTVNLPHDLASVVEDRLKEMSGDIGQAQPYLKDKNGGSRISDYIPKQEEHDFADLFGQKNTPTLMDRLIQGGVEYLPEIVGGRALLRGAMRRATGTHHLDTVKKAAQEFGGDNFAYPSHIVNEAQKYLPKTEASRQLISKSKAGQYPASFDLRSQLGKHQRDLSTSALASERLLAPQLGELRQKMLGQLQDALRQEGMHVEADMLHQGIRNYAQYMRVKDAVMPVIKKLGIPTSIAAAIGFGYTKGKNLVKD